MNYILIADDEPMNLEMLEIMLMDDYEIKCVENGIECIKSVEERIPDLLLLDFSMPEMDGIEVCKKLRGNKKTQHIPIVILSGFSSEEHMHNGREAGANEYIEKPFTQEAILKIAEKYIRS